MSLFTKNLDLIIRSMEQGRDLKLASGHTLSWVEEYDAPGFLATKTGDGKEEEIVFQIGSDVAWMSLISHAKKMTEEESMILAANMALTEINRKKR